VHRGRTYNVRGQSGSLVQARLALYIDSPET
jgi:hypothetical protein